MRDRHCMEATMRRPNNPKGFGLLGWPVGTYPKRVTAGFSSHLPSPPTSDQPITGHAPTSLVVTVGHAVGHWPTPSIGLKIGR